LRPRVRRPSARVIWLGVATAIVLLALGLLIALAPGLVLSLKGAIVAGVGGLLYAWLWAESIGGRVRLYNHRRDRDR